MNLQSPSTEKEMVRTPCTCALTLLFTVLCLTSDWRFPGSTSEGKWAFKSTSMVTSLAVIYLSFMNLQSASTEKEMVCTPCTCALTLLFTVEFLTSDWRCPGSTGEEGKRAFKFTSMLTSFTVIYFEFHEPTEPINRERDGTHTMHLCSNFALYGWINFAFNLRLEMPRLNRWRR